MTEAKSGDGTTRIKVESVSKGFIVTERDTYEEQITKAPRLEIWMHEWSTGGVVHRLSATMTEFRYNRAQSVGIRAILPSEGEPAPGAMTIGMLEMVGGVAVGVSEVGHRELARVLAGQADAFREANLALEADGAPPIHSLSSLAGVLVRVVKDRREYADSYASAKTDLDRERREMRIANDVIRIALNNVGERTQGWVAPLAAQVLGRMHRDLAALRARDKDEDPGRDALNAALHEAGEPAGGMMLETAAKVIRRLLAHIEGHRAVALSTGAAAARMAKAWQRLTPTQASHVATFADQLQRGEQEQEPSPMTCLRMMGALAAVAVGRVRVRASDDVPITFIAHENDRPEVRALDREQLAVALAKLCCLYNDAEHAEDAEKTLANFLAALEEVVQPFAAHAGEPTIDTVKRLVAQRADLDAEAQRRAHDQAVIRDALSTARYPSETALDTIQRLVRERAVDPGQSLHAEKEEMVVAIAPVRETGETVLGCVQRLVAEAEGRLQETRRKAEMKRVGIEVAAPAKEPDPSWLCGAESNAGGKDRTCTRPKGHGGHHDQNPNPSEPTFTWEPVAQGAERFCKATAGDVTAQGCVRSVHAGKGWAGFANGKSLGLTWPDAMTEAQAMRWVEKQIAEQLARLVLEKSAPLGAKTGPWTVTASDLNLRDPSAATAAEVATAMSNDPRNGGRSFIAMSKATYDEDDADTSGSSR